MPSDINPARSGALWSTRLAEWMRNEPTETQTVSSPSSDTEAISRSLALLSVHVQSLLNQSPDRVAALDAYVQSLQSALDENHSRLAQLEQSHDTLTDETRMLRRSTRDMENELKQIIRGKEQGDAVSLMQTLTLKKQALSHNTVQLDLTRTVVDALQDTIEPLTERIQAIEANREALITGIQVRETPGTEDIGILQKVRR